MTSHENNPTTFERQQYGEEQSAKDKARETADQVAHQAKEETQKLASNAKEEARSMAEQRKGQMTSELNTIAEAFRTTSQELRKRNEEPVARYATKVADQLEHASSYLREHSVDDILGDAENFARQQPELFLGGAFGLGVLISRFFKSSERDRYGDQYQGNRYGYGRDFRSGQYTQGSMRSQQRVRSDLPTTYRDRGTGSTTLPEGQRGSGSSGGTS